METGNAEGQAHLVSTDVILQDDSAQTSAAQKRGDVGSKLGGSRKTELWVQEEVEA